MQMYRNDSGVWPWLLPLRRIDHVYVESWIKSSSDYNHVLSQNTVWYICTLQYKLHTEINTTVGSVGAQTQGFMAQGSEREREQKIGLDLRGIG